MPVSTQADRPTAADMMSRILAEDTLSFMELTKEFPVAHRPHVSAMYRWHKHGLQGQFLAAVRIGGLYVSSRQALHRFIEATQV